MLAWYHLYLFDDGFLITQADVEKTDAVAPVQEPIVEEPETEATTAAGVEVTDIVLTLLLALTSPPQAT
jgi:hypothetical protein